MIVHAVLIETELEKINTAILLWHYQHKGCEEEIFRYRQQIQRFNDDPGLTDSEAEFLVLFAAKEEYRALYAHEWKGN
jgi:hypothetical protein